MIAEEGDSRQALAKVDQTQCLEQQGLGGIIEAEDQEMGALTETRIHAEVQGLPGEQGPRGAIANRKGLDPPGIGGFRHRQGRSGFPRVHQDQPLGRPVPAVRAVAGTLNEVGDEVGGPWRIGQDEKGRSSRLQHRQLLAIDAPSPAAIPTQTDNHLVRERGGAHDQDRGSQEGKRSHGIPSGREGPGQDPRQPGPGLGQVQYLDEGGIGLLQTGFGQWPARATPSGQAIRGAAAAGQNQDAAASAEAVHDVQKGDGAARRDQHEAAVPASEMLGHVRDPGGFIAPALARYQEEMGVIGVEVDLGVRLDARRIRNPSGGIERDTPQGCNPEQRETRGRTAACQSHQGHDTEGGAAIDDQGTQFVKARRQALKNREQCAARRRIEVRGTTDQD